MELRLEGLTYAEIASKIGYASAAGAHKSVRRALVEVGADEARELLPFQLMRLDDLLAQVWPVATDPTHPRQDAAIITALRIMHKMDVLVRLDS
jgi:hypothetical protein